MYLYMHGDAYIHILKPVITNYWIKLDNFAVATSHNDLGNLLQDLLHGESGTVLKMMILCYFDS